MHRRPSIHSVYITANIQSYLSICTIWRRYEQCLPTLSIERSVIMYQNTRIYLHHRQHDYHYRSDTRKKKKSAVPIRLNRTSIGVSGLRKKQPKNCNQKTDLTDMGHQFVHLRVSSLPKHSGRRCGERDHRLRRLLAPVHCLVRRRGQLTV
jgi:hypothetical protein